METSRCNLDIPRHATPEEAAAIAAAIEAHLATDGPTEPSPERWSGSKWAFAGRLVGLGGPPGRVPDGVPSDPWTAAGRVDRF